MTNKGRSKNPWKMSMRKVPERILQKVRGLSKDDFVVTCVKRITASDIAAGHYEHLGLRLSDGVPEFPQAQIPSPKVGRFSAFNTLGTEIVLKNLPKTTRTYTVEVPNYGDWSNGSHEVEWDREVYQREDFPAKELEIRTEILGEEIREEKVYVFKFSVGDVLNRREIRFPERRSLKNSLFFNLNLLQENVGVADIFPSDATRADYLRSVFVDWEILPPGEREETVERILTGFKAPTEALRRKLSARYNLLARLKPKAFIRGTSGLRRYFGAQFADDLVVFENLEYGNAIYIMFEDWETLSRLSRVELLKGDRKGFTRIVHRKGWEEKLKELVAKRVDKDAA